jgi:hypothetical protein
MEDQIKRHDVWVLLIRQEPTPEANASRSACPDTSPPPVTCALMRIKAFLIERAQETHLRTFPRAIGTSP